MALWQNLPFAMIMLPLASASFTSVMKSSVARRTAVTVLAIETMLGIALTVFMARYNGSYTFMMGHFPAPWGNEIRAGMLEAVVSVSFTLVMLLAVVGGMRKILTDIAPEKQSLYFVMIELTQAAIMAQVFTNDVFTGYVFLEIMTIAACALISARTKGRTLVAATRYMIMNLIGSGLFLLGLTLLYDLTGHLLMSNIQEQVRVLNGTGLYRQPMQMVIALITIGLAIKSALFPFHTWVPDAYSSSTPTTSAVLSSLISKGYIFLLMKFYYRVFGMETIRDTRIGNVLFIFSLIGIVMGSISAIFQREIRRMIAYSSVAQIGYIFMGMSIGTDAAMGAAVFQMIAHSICKSMLFISAGGLSDASNGNKTFRELRGCGYRCPVAGVAFTVGSLSLIGVPFFSGFMVKVYLAQAAMVENGLIMLLTLFVLAVSTVLNTAYFGKTVITLYRVSPEEAAHQTKFHPGFGFTLSCVSLSVITALLGIASQSVMQGIMSGISHFS